MTLESLRIKSRLIPAIVSYIPATPICSGSPLLVNQGVYVLCPKATTTGFAYNDTSIRLSSPMVNISLGTSFFGTFLRFLRLFWFLQQTFSAIPAAKFPALPPDFNRANPVYPTTPTIRRDALFAIISIFKLQSILRSAPLQIYDD
eukprot:jgi/Psemu1/38078/gm1.38078_g